MKQRSYAINLVAWGLVIVLFGMLLVFSRLGSAPSYVYGSAYGSTYSSTDPSLRALLAYSLPGVLYAVGVVGGLVWVRRRGMAIPATARTSCRVVTALALGNVALSLVPALTVDWMGLSPFLAMFSLALVAPVVPAALGVVYALSWAPVRACPCAAGAEAGDKDAAGEKDVRSDATPADSGAVPVRPDGLPGGDVPDEGGSSGR